jgi:PPM family protein phosphatase
MKTLDTVTTPLTDIQVAAGTHEGMTGKNNEDAYQFAAWQEEGQTLYLAVVADGVGGQTAGELASHIVVDSLIAYFDVLPRTELSSRNVLKHLLQAIEEANTAVYQRAQSDRAVQGMATTIVVAAIYQGRLYTSHVGDSRIYFWRNQQLHQITQDHSWVQEAVDAGLLTPEQARTHPNRNVIRRSLGTTPETEVDQTPNPGALFITQKMALQQGDVILLCSDGLSDMITDEAIAETLKRHGQDLDTAVNDLINQANEAGGRDNITVLLLHALKGTPPMLHEEPHPITATATLPPLSHPTTTYQDSETDMANKPRIVPVDHKEQEKTKQKQKRKLQIIALSIAIVAIITFFTFFYFS